MCGSIFLILSAWMLGDLKTVPDVTFSFDKFTGELWCHAAIISHDLRRRNTSRHPANSHPPHPPPPRGGNVSRGRRSR